MQDEDLGNDPFKVEFVRVEREGFPIHDRECFKVTFDVSRRSQSFSVSVYVDDDKAVWEEVVRLAMHQLHRDFAELAHQLEDRKLSPEQIAKLA